METEPIQPVVETGMPENVTEIQSSPEVEMPFEDERSKVFENPAEDHLIVDTEESIAAATNERMDEMRQEPGGAPQDASEDAIWKRAYEEEGVKQWNEFAEENPEKAEKYREERKRWYEKAREKAEQVMKEIDPEYTVAVQDSIVSPDDNDRAEYRTAALAFKSPKGPEYCWSMEIEPSDDYIQSRLSDAIRKIYGRKREGIFERNAGRRNVEGIQQIKFDFFPTKDERYLASELDRLDKLEQIRADLGVEKPAGNEILLRALLKFKEPKRFILDRGTIRQRTLEISVRGGVVSLAEKIARGNRRRTWTLAANGEITSSDGASGIDLKQLLEQFNQQVRAKKASPENGEVAHVRNLR